MLQSSATNVKLYVGCNKPNKINSQLTFQCVQLYEALAFYGTESGTLNSDLWFQYSLLYYGC